MLLLFAALSAHAADLRVAWNEPLGEGVVDVVLGPAERSVGALEAGTGQLRLLSLEDWDVDAYDDICTGTGTALTAYASSDSTIGDRYYVGCDDGTVGWLTRAGDEWTVSSAPVALDSGSVLGLVVINEKLWADGEGNPQIFGFTPTSDGGTALVEGGILGVSGYKDFEAAAAVGFVAHGSNRMSRIDGSTGSITVPTNTIGVADTKDIIVTPGNAVLCAAGEGGMVSYTIGGSDMSLLLDDSDGLVEVTALAWMDDWLWLADTGAAEFKAFEMSSSATVPGDDLQDRVDYPDAADGVVEVAVSDGYAIAGTSGGSLWVLTDRPWVTAGVASPTTAIQGDTVTFSLESDRSGTWTVYRDATTDTDGDALASGSIQADTATTASFTFGGAFAEGENIVRVVVEDEDGVTGHDAVTIRVDNPPNTVWLPKDGVSFGDGRLFVAFDALEAEDVSDYAIFVTTEPFSRGDWARCDDGTVPCGPAYEGPDDVTSPIEVTASAGDTISVEVDGLTNGTTYYIAARAIDASGQEGGMSKVRTALPEETYGIAGLTGWKGGYCGLGLSGSIGLALAGLGAAVSRRRRGSAVVGVALVTLGLAAAPAASAQDPIDEEPGLRDRLAERGTFAARYGNVSFDSSDVNAVLNQGESQMLWVEAGPRLFKQAELTLGLGRMKEPGKLVTLSQRVSGEDATLRAIPLSANATLRGEFFEDQPVVPYATAGVEYWLVEEEISASSTADPVTSGGMFGYHYGFGGNLLLDVFDRRRASLLQARTGIDNTWLTVEYRVRSVSDDDLVLSGSTLGFGLKLDY